MNLEQEIPAEMSDTASEHEEPANRNCTRGTWCKQEQRGQELAFLNELGSTQETIAELLKDERELYIDVVDPLAHREAVL